MLGRDLDVHLQRLRLGFAVVAVAHLLFWLGRSEVQAVPTRLAIILGCVALVALSYLSVARRRAPTLAVLSLTLVIVAQSWVTVSEGMRHDFILPPMLLFLAICAIAASLRELWVSATVALLAPPLLLAVHGWDPGQVPVVPLLLLLAATAAGIVIGWFRLRTQALLTREIEERQRVARELRSARAHLESILNATSDGLLGVRYEPEGPRITFANRRFGQIFDLDPAAVTGRWSRDVRALVAGKFRDPEAFERDVQRLYAERSETRLDEIELVHPRPAVLERWTGPIANAEGTVVGRIWSFRDVTAARTMARDRERYATELELTNAELARASRAKDAFLANLSHELRTPLSVIIGYQDLLGEGGLSDAEVADFLTRATASAHHLLRLISDMLDLTRLEAGTADITPEPIAVAPVLDEVRSLTEVLALARGLELGVAAGPDVAVLADRQRLKQVLLNLVGNALKFTDRGSVRVTAQAGDAWVTFVVRDTGRGIPREQQPLLFQKFVQLDAGGAQQGVGLGLSICRELVGAMGGEITLASEGAGCGTEVRFTLPHVPRLEDAPERSASA